MPWVNIFYIMLLFVVYAAVLRFKNRKFFYYVYTIAAAEPVLHLVRKIIPLNNAAYISIVSVFLLISVPTIDYKKKIIGVISLLAIIIHYEFQPLFELIINLTVFSFIIFSFLEEFYNEIKVDKVGHVFLLLLVLDILINSFLVFTTIEDISILVSFSLLGFRSKYTTVAESGSCRPRC